MKKPTYQDLYHYILKNGQAEKTADEYVASIAEDLNLTASDLAERYPSGEGVIRNRVRWAIHYLLRARLLEKPSRGHFVISESGKTFSSSHRGPFSNSDLNEIPEFQEFKNKTKREETHESDVPNAEIVTNEKSELTPIERIEVASSELDSELQKELLERILEQTPAFFERLVVALLSKMGYGSENSLAKAIGKSGDGGIDGVIHQDKLGLDVVYIQAKRYEPSNQVGRPDVNAFVGSLAGHQTNKGVFVTTSYFSKPALEYLKTIQTRIITIDGKRLVELMIEHQVGTRVAYTFKVNKIDEDFFLD